MSILKNKRVQQGVLWCAFILYVVLSIGLFRVHEPWRDEAHAWQIAVSTDSVQDLFTAARYEGTPVLWHMVLRGIYELGGGFIHARLLHMFFAIIAVGVFLWKAPLLWWQKAMLPFGYFVLFEFAVVARSYSLTMLFLFLLAAVWQYRDTQTLWFVLLLIGLAHTNIFGWIMVLILCCVLVYESVEQYIRSSMLRQELELRTAVGVIAVVAGLIAVPWMVLPTADVSPHLTGVVGVSHSSITHAITQALRIFIPLSNTQPTFWNNVWNLEVLDIVVGQLLFVGSLMSFRLYHIRYRWMVAYIAMLAATIGLLSLKGIQHIRFSGLVFLFWLACIWIGKQDSVQIGAGKIKGKLYTVGRAMLGIILAAQVLASVPAVLFEYTAPFSNASATALFLEESGFTGDDTLLSAAFSSVGTALLPHMDRDYIYSPELRRNVSVILWNTEYYDAVLFTPEEVLASVEEEFSAGEYARSVVVFNDPLGDEFMNYSLVNSETGAIVPDEDFYIYLRNK